MNEAQRKYHRDWYHAHKHIHGPRKTARAAKQHKFLVRIASEIKLFLGCVYCGYNHHPRALDFHHKKPELKSFNVSNINCRSVMRMLKEIEKCDVVCANCHRIRT